MKNLLKPLWLLVINTLPVVVLLTLLFADYQIIRSMLSEQNIFFCQLFAGILLGLSCCTLFYSLLQWKRKQELSWLYGLISLIAYTAFLYAYFFFLQDIFPSRIPDWMMGNDVVLYVGTFLMPTLAHAIIVLVTHLTNPDKKYAALYNFLLALGIPGSLYIFSQLLLPLHHYLPDINLGPHVVVVSIVTLTILFLFFLIRAFYIILYHKSTFLSKYSLAWKIPIALVLPLAGLLVNNSMFNSENIFDSNEGVFGNFNNVWFYILATVNGILICLPDLQHKVYRLLLFIARSITFAYTLYFFVVFLPFLPLSVLAILLFGFGLLLLSPLILFVVHISQLAEDVRYLTSFFTKKVIYSIGVSAFLILPASITFQYLHDRWVLKETLRYVYTPDYTQSSKIDVESLAHTLSVLKSHKDNGRSLEWGSQSPYLSSYFKWIVLDHMSLSETKIKTIEQIFYGKSSEKTERITNEQRSNTVQLTQTKVSSRFDEKNQHWISWVDLELKNNSGIWNAEYMTTIDLPAGCWISDYYLYVGKKKEKGLLTEKKAALWVYNQIRNTKRDPGILYYLTGNKVVFKVFPFADGEVRRTGIQFIHREPLQLALDNAILQLGIAENTLQNNKEENSVHYISLEEKKALLPVKRVPYYYFIVDCSQGKEKLQTQFISRIEKLLIEKPISMQRSQVCFTNTYCNVVTLDNDWKSAYKHQTSEGGFYLERAIKGKLFQHYTKPSNTYPVFVVVTDTLDHAIVEKDFSDFAFTYPETEWFYELGDYLALTAHSLFQEPLVAKHRVTDIPSLDEWVLAWPDAQHPSAYLAHNDQASIVLKNRNNLPVEDLTGNTAWEAGLALQQAWMSQVLYPQSSERGWLAVVKGSFDTGIMTPLTSYIVVETEAQKAMILKKQKQTLAGNKSLDLEEEPQRMSEPEWYIIAGLLAVFLIFRNYKKVKKMIPAR